MSLLLIKNGTIVSSKEERSTDLLLEDGVVKEMGSVSTEADEVINAADLLVMPGLIDCHVHFREPGHEEKGNIESESRSARYGGVRTACDMPNTNPPTVTKEAFADKVSRRAKTHHCDLRFFFGITQKEHIEELKSVYADEALRPFLAGVKLYLDHSTGNQKIEEALISDALSACAELGIVAVAHCEDPHMNAEAMDRYGGSYVDVEAHSRVRPPEAEEASVASAIEAAHSVGAHLHVAHLSTAGALSHVRSAKRDGVTVTCEVTPHHLLLGVEDYEALGTLAKMNPPLRTKEHRDALWEGIADRTIDCVSTDHAPHTYEEKQVKPPLTAPSGVPGVETMLPLLLTIAAGSDALSYSDIVRLCFENPNQIFSLKKDPIEIGKSPEWILVDPKKTWEISAKSLHAKCGWTPFEGWIAKGKVHQLA